MAKRIITVNTLITYILEFLLILTLPYLLYKKDYMIALVALIAIVVSLIPMMVKRNYNLTIPWIMQFLIILGLYLHIIGITFRWYDKLAYWDLITHILGSAVIAMIAFMVVYVLYFLGKIKVTVKMIGLFTVVFTMAIGALWEVTEYGVDATLHTNNQKDLADTNWDMIYDVLAGIVVAFLGMWYVKKTPESIINLHIKYFLNKRRLKRIRITE